MDADQVLLFRLNRLGLADRDARSLAEAAACPVSDFARDAAVVALAARRDGVTRRPTTRHRRRRAGRRPHRTRRDPRTRAGDFALYGRALVSGRHELASQLGQQVQRLAADKGFAPTDALAEVAAATKEALQGGRALSKNELHDELRRRVNEDLMPWCRGCGSHHGTDALALRNDQGRRPPRLRAPLRARQAGPDPRRRGGGRALPPFLRPSTVGDFCDWAGWPSLTPSVSGSASRATSSRAAWESAPPGCCGATAARSIPASGTWSPAHPTWDPYLQDAEPGAARTGCGAAQATLPSRSEPGRGASGRAAQRPVASEGKGKEAS